MIAAQFAAVLASLVLAVLTELARRGLAALKAHVRSERVRKAMEQLLELSSVCVMHAAQTVVEDLKDPTKPGEWNAVAARAVRESVRADVSTLAKAALGTLKTDGQFSSAELNRVVEAAIEAAVLSLKGGQSRVLEAEPIAQESAS